MKYRKENDFSYQIRGCWEDDNIHQEEKLFIVKISRGRSKNTLLQVKVQIYYQLNVLKVTEVKKQHLLLWQQIVVLELIW